MTLTDIMSAMKLSTFPQAAMLIFLGVFVAVVWRVYRRPSIREMDAAASIPLCDEVVTPRKPEALHATLKDKAEV